MKNLLYTRRRPSFRKIFGWVLAAVSALLVLLQVVYYAVLLPYGIEYIYDGMPFFLNGVILVSISFSLFCFFFPKKRVLLAILSGFLLLFMINLIFFFLLGTSHRTEVRFSPDAGHQLIVKQEKETGNTRIYRNPILWVLAKPGDEFPYPAYGDMKFQWITSDICTITYRSKNGEIHQYTRTYGERGNGISYFYVLNAIRGTWNNTDEGQPAPPLEADAYGITLTSSDGTKRLSFSSENCVQFGTTSLTLCTKDGIPLYSLSLGENCTLDQNDTILPGGSLLLCPISMEETESFVYERTGGGAGDFETSN